MIIFKIIFRVCHLVWPMALMLTTLCAHSASVPKSQEGSNGFESIPLRQSPSQNNPKVNPDTSYRIPGELNSHSFGIGLGETFLIGKFEKFGEDTISLDFLYTYSASYSFDLLGNLHYSKHKFKDEHTLLRGATLGIKSKLYQFDSFSPFIGGGFGFYRPLVKRRFEVNGQVAPLESEAKTTFGFHLDAGADLRLNHHMSIGLLSIFHKPFSIKQVLGPDVEGSYFKLLMTLMYTL